MSLGYKANIIELLDEDRTRVNLDLIAISSSSMLLAAVDAEEI